MESILPPLVYLARCTDLYARSVFPYYVTSVYILAELRFYLFIGLCDPKVLKRILFGPEPSSKMVVRNSRLLIRVTCCVLPEQELELP